MVRGFSQIVPTTEFSFAARKYTLPELQNFKVGTVGWHEVLGNFFVSRNFDRNFPTYKTAFVFPKLNFRAIPMTAGYPFNQPMRLS